MPSLRVLLLATLLGGQAANAAPADVLARGDEFAWRLFVALNLTDGTAQPGAAVPGAWERWENAADVYRPGGADPGPWRARGESVIATEHRFESLSGQNLPNARRIVAGRMVPLQESLAGAPHLVEIRMNRLAFDYVRAEGLYNLDGQVRHVTTGLPVQFPAGSIEVKASWRPISATDSARYHTLQVRFADGSTGLFGLEALNIAAKEQPEWFWASFEHADNATRPDGEGWKLPSRDLFACRDAAPDCNRIPGGLGLENTPWQNYRLRGTMTRYLADSGEPQRLGNSVLESGLQESASCMTCHARAALAVVNGVPERLPIFDSRPGEDVRVRHGYIGEPDPAWYHRPGQDGAPGPVFEPLDFVWSLAQAKPLVNQSMTGNGVRR